WIQLPDRYLLTSIGSTDNLAAFLQTLTRALQNGLKLVQFREPAWMAASASDAYDGLRQVAQHCHEYGAQCLVNSIHPESWRALADGVHYRATDALALAQQGD